MTIGAIGVYLVEVSLFMLMLYLFNKLLLGRDTLHRFNRYMWLATIVLSFIAPFAVGGDVVTSDLLPVAVGEVQGVVVEGVESVAMGWSRLEVVVNIIFALYLIGVVVLVVRNIGLYWMLFRMVRSVGEEDIEWCSTFRDYEAEMGINTPIRYVIHDTELSPFSWFGYVVVSRNDLEDSAKEIILHELSHVQQRHSWDILLANFTTIILWFNPASWLLKRALQQVHEYCADESVLARGVNAKRYQLLLIKKSVGSRLNSISNTLNHSNLKNRITMMLKPKTPKMAVAKCLYAIPLMLCMVALFSSPTVAMQSSTLSEVKVMKNSETTTTEVEKDVQKDEPFLFTEVMPLFEGGSIAEFRKWVMMRVKYPAEMAKNEISGRVIVSFIVERDGSLSTFTTLSSPSDAFSQEVVRVLKLSPKWTPAMQRGEKVRLKYTLPVEFSLTKEEKTEEKKE